MQEDRLSATEKAARPRSSEAGQQRGSWKPAVFFGVLLALLLPPYVRVIRDIRVIRVVFWFSAAWLRGSAAPQLVLSSSEA